ncbi:MAG: YtxH domain-containing protein [Candidatus Coatesbacteria bacterium]|nr:MAG: YtxH domain-containing protein [Candidatus Coatesbacteria bacterium]
MADSTGQTTGLMFLSFIVGGIVGSVLGILFAPKAGAETREDIAKFAADVKDETEKVTKAAVEKIEKVVDEAQKALSKKAAGAK